MSACRPNEAVSAELALCATIECALLHIIVAQLRGGWLQTKLGWVTWQELSVATSHSRRILTTAGASGLECTTLTRADWQLTAASAAASKRRDGEIILVPQHREDRECLIWPALLNSSVEQSLFPGCGLRTRHWSRSRSHLLRSSDNGKREVDTQGSNPNCNFNHAAPSSAGLTLG